MTLEEIAAAEARAEAATKHVEQCVSEQGHNGILWTLFEGAPFSSERIASFAKAEDARAFIRSQLDLPDALDALEEAEARETELRAALKEFAWHRGSCEASMMTPVDYDNLESDEYYVSGPCTCGYDDFAKKHPDAQSFIYDERDNGKTTYTCHPWSEERQKATDAQRVARAALGDENGSV